MRERDDLGLNAVRVVGLDPVWRQLLGAATNPLGHWIPADEDVPLRAAMR